MSPAMHDNQRNLQVWRKKLRYLAERDAKRLEKSTSRTEQEEKSGIREAIQRKNCAATN
jgi:hypothetical protein